MTEKEKQKKQVIDGTQSLYRVSQKEGQSIIKSTTGAPRLKRLSVGVSSVLLCGWWNSRIRFYRDDSKNY